MSDRCAFGVILVAWFKVLSPFVDNGPQCDSLESQTFTDDVVTLSRLQCFTSVLHFL